MSKPQMEDPSQPEMRRNRQRRKTLKRLSVQTEERGKKLCHEPRCINASVLIASRKRAIQIKSCIDK
jgi:hypothetical protein